VSKSVFFLDGPEKNKLMSLPYEKGSISFYKYEGHGKNFLKNPPLLKEPPQPKEYKYVISKIAEGYPRGYGLDLYGARLS